MTEKAQLQGQLQASVVLAAVAPTTMLTAHASVGSPLATMLGKDFQCSCA